MADKTVTSRSRIEWFDMVRGMAAIVVVLFHFRAYLGIEWLSFGFLAVEVFFILSGIVLGLKYTEAIQAGMTFGAFVGVRLRRLYPMVFIAACFVVTIDMAGVPAAFDASDRYAWLLFFVMPLPSYWPAGAAFPADGPMWSLWAELVANAIWFFAVRFGPRWSSALGIVTMVWLVYLAATHKTLGDGFQQTLPMLNFAVVSALAWFSVGFFIARAEVTLRVPAWVAFLTLLALLAWFAHGSGHPWILSMLIVSVSAVFLHALLRATPPSQPVAKLAHFLGLASFPMYLIHLPAGRLVHFVDPYLPRPIALMLIIGATTVAATWLNEIAVRHVHARHRRKRAAAISIAAS